MKMLCAILTVAMLIANCATAQDDKPLMAYIGTFSSPLKDTLPTQLTCHLAMGAEFICFRSIGAQAHSPPPGRSISAPSPGCLAVNKSGTIMYSANERIESETKRKAPSVRTASIAPPVNSSYSIQYGSQWRSRSHLHQHSSGWQTSTGCQLLRWLDSRVTHFWPMASWEPSDVKDDAGKIGPTKAVNAPPGSFAFSGHDRTHSHMIEADAAGNFVFHADLGLDLIYIWRFDVVTGKLSPAATPTVALPPGDGPRHFHFHPNGKWFYSIQEESSTLVLFDLRSSHGRFEGTSDHFDFAAWLCR